MKLFKKDKTPTGAKEEIGLEASLVSLQVVGFCLTVIEG